MQIAHANTARPVPEFVCINAIAQLRIALHERLPLTQLQLTCRLSLTSSWLKAAGPPTPALHIPTWVCLCFRIYCEYNSAACVHAYACLVEGTVRGTLSNIALLS